ncbi:permease [Flavobacterium noncentrifugens]|uniref:Threonine/homoserine efflux transporter RhtA n=1 Tax=Flavobacterium noncentrifugens TaxID=1128970 RepID=A0A1G8VCY5_9FLAO|nr:DMT family transporter [Flavobacterium noncentrifugens]GEP50444.1 permease [Flavobacterium noncentrifugens]SDJ63774.1 Threonine/homoserine efflux transporter RhtA [Flavobacterium noncentrifugens]
MTNNNLIKGVFLVSLGATSYGMLATFVKLAYSDTGITGNPFTPAEVISSQFILGIIAILIINWFQKIRNNGTAVKANRRDITQLMVAGTSTGLTSIFYYLAVKYIPVSIGIVLLMQTVWMGVLLEMFLEKKIPSPVKIVAVAIVLLGTALATNLIHNNNELDWRGIVLGLLAAASFTTTMFTANRVAVHISSAQRSLYMLLGGAVIVFIFACVTISTPINYDIFYKWGILLALFGTVIPPMLLNAGFPHTGIGLGSIVSSLELPVSVTMAYFLLNEEVIGLQWFGIALILFAIVIMNVNFKPKSK